MLLKKYRLKSNTQIGQIFKNGKTVRSSFLFLRYAPNNLEKTRFAFSVGLKYSKKAVDRNRAKRILRIVGNELLKKIKPGFDLVFYFDENFQEEISTREISKIMKSCLIKARILK